MLQPTIGGKLALSRGVAVLAAPAPQNEHPAQQQAQAGAAGSVANPPAERDLVAKAFAVLAQKGGIAKDLPAFDLLQQVRGS